MSLTSDRTLEPDGSVRVVLRGSIAETVDIAAVFAGIDKPLMIDLSGVTRINSIGLKHWVSAFGPLSKAVHVDIEGVPYAFVMQANCIRNVFGDAAVRSCLAPYFCASCNASRSPVVTLADLEGAGGGIPVKVCEGCNKPMEFDEFDGYFAFLRHRSPG